MLIYIIYFCIFVNILIYLKRHLIMENSFIYLAKDAVCLFLNSKEAQESKNLIIEVEGIEVFDKIESSINIFNVLIKKKFYDIIPTRITSIDEEFRDFVSDSKNLYMVRNFVQKIVGDVVTENDCNVLEMALKCLNTKQEYALGCNFKLLPEMLKLARKIGVKLHHDDDTELYFRYSNPESLFSQMKNAAMHASNEKIVFDSSEISEATARIYATRLRKMFYKDITCKSIGSKIILYFGPQSKESVFQDKLRVAIYPLRDRIYKELLELCTEVINEVAIKELKHIEPEPEFIEEVIEVVKESFNEALSEFNEMNDDF
jgi:hypothetical protein